MSISFLQGDCLSVLKTLPDESVNCCVTSPPYYALRDYGVEGQLGLEQTPEAYIAKMVEVFREVKRVLREDGTCWINIGDSYAGAGYSNHKNTGGAKKSDGGKQKHLTGTGLKNKDLIGIPWMLAFALRADGWYLRQDIIWCLSGGAWVYARTQKGDMPVMVKDLVRLDPKTVSLWNGSKWTRVLGWGRSNDEGERLEIVLRSGERIGCTGGHQWPTQRGNVKGVDLQVGDVIRTCKLPQPDGSERPSYLTDDALWLIGLYLAEGSRNGRVLQLSLSADEQRWIPRIEEICQHYGGSCSHSIVGGSLNIRMYGSVIHAIVNAYIGGRTAKDKHLKVSTWRLPDDAIKFVICGYLDGDGHSDSSNDRWRLGFCRNYALERDLRTAAARLGATLTLKPVMATYQGGELPAFRGEWRWSRSGHSSEKDRGEVVCVRVSRARKFWDIAVEDDPHLFALASGVLTHNCKPNPMPESVRDRCTKAHEYVFLMSKSDKYYYDNKVIMEPAIYGEQHAKKATSWGTNRKHPNKANTADYAFTGDNHTCHKSEDGRYMKNKRSVWTVTTKPYKGAHFATFPPDLIRPCILAGCPEGGTVLDPFGGSGTTGQVAKEHGRNAILIELNSDYIKLAKERCGES